MKLSLKFGLVVLALLAGALGGGAWLYMHNQQVFLNQQQQALQVQRESMEKEVKRRAATVAAFGEAARDYTQKVLAPAVDKHVKDTMIFEAQSRTFVARGTIEQFRQKPGMTDYSFR